MRDTIPRRILLVLPLASLACSEAEDPLTTPAPPPSIAADAPLAAVEASPTVATQGPVEKPPAAAPQATDEALAAAASPVYAEGSGAAPSSDAAQDRADETARKEAIRRGLEWMLANADAFPAGWAHPFLLRVHRVTADDATAASIEAVLRDDSARSRRGVIPKELPNLANAHSAMVTPILFELRRRMQMGEPYEKELAKVEAWLTANEAVLWPKFTPTQQSVFLHLYRELGIEAPVEFEQVYADQRRAATTRHPTSVARDHAVLYGLTHLILYESGYYRRYVDRERYEFLIPCFRAAIDRVTTSRMPSARDLDLLAELVSSFRLMRLPQDDWTSRAIAYLIEHQAQNGLWGKGPNVNMWSAHGTQTALLALMDYPDELRPDPRLDQPLSD